MNDNKDWSGLPDEEKHPEGGKPAGENGWEQRSYHEKDSFDADDQANRSDGAPSAQNGTPFEGPYNGDYGATGYGGVQGGDYSRNRTSGKDPYAGRDYSGAHNFTGSSEPRGAQHHGDLYGTSEWNFAEYDRPKQKRHTRGPNILGMVLSCVLAVSVVFFAGYSIWSLMNGNRSVGESSSSSIPTVPGLNIQDSPDTTYSSTVEADGPLSNVEIIRKVSPSVVGIAAYSGNSSFSPSSQGSGIIMTQDGYIVTNAHVVSGAKGITVYLENGDTYAATLVGADDKTDLAVLKIEASNLAYAEFGNSDKLERGEPVLAIGNPGGMQLAGSVTGGMVSGVNRSLSSSSPYSTSYIQVDAAINPGNSGGALVNAYGQVIGINSAKIAELDYEGIGFAIPINEALPIIQELMENGHVTGRAALGVTGVMVDDTLAMFRRLPVGFGIESIDPSSDLVSKAAPGDIITHIEGEEVTSYDVISNVLAKHKPGDTVRLKIYRQNPSVGNGRSFEVNVILSESTQ